MSKIDMAIDKTIYNNGINGRLSYWEIDSLPSDYEGLKSMFRDATRRRESVELEKKSFTGRREEIRQQMLHEGVNSEFRSSTPPRPMSRLEEEKRIMQVLTRASYGMSREKAFASCDQYGVMTKWQKFMVKVKFIFNIKSWWNIIMLRRNLKKRWKEERKLYRKQIKEDKYRIKHPIVYGCGMASC